MTAARLRRRSASAPHRAVEEGPFVSFTDLFVGIIFLFLILVAALMLRQQQQQTPPPPEPPKPQPIVKQDPKLPAFRLGIVFNIYQRSASSDGVGWIYSRTVRVFRSPDGRCINTVWMRSNLTTAWRPPTSNEDIPTDADPNQFKKFEPCGLSASGDHWSSASETGDLKRIGPNLYSGFAVLHEKEGDEKLEMQYRVLGVYDDYFRQPGA
jgi:hypothetical protein